MGLLIKKLSDSCALRLFLSHLFFITFIFLIYRNLPYYQNFLSAETKLSFLIVYIFYLFSAPIYYLVAFHRRWLTVEDLRISKSTLMLQYLSRLLHSLFNLFQGKGRELGQVFTMNFPTRTAFLSLAVKCFFIPVMTNYFFIHVRATIYLLSHVPLDLPLYSFLFDWCYWLIYNCMFIFDVGIFITAYGSEARWLGNQIKSVEPTLVGWFVALICYPPLQNVSGRLLPIGTGTILVITSLPVLACMKVLTLFFFVIYVWASASLFMKAGNLVNRGIVSSGAYGVVRHPAYISKCLAWWMEKMPYGLFDLRVIFFLLCWNIIYFFRAITEERHLSRDPHYLAYIQKVRYRFIPGVF